MQGPNIFSQFWIFQELPYFLIPNSSWRNPDVKLPCSMHHPAWQYWCNTEVNLLCRVKNTSCSAVSAQHWGNPVMQHQKFTLYDSIGAILNWTCYAGSKIYPVSQYQCNIEVILSCNIRNSPCITVLAQYWDEPVLQGQKYILFLSINAILS